MSEYRHGSHSIFRLHVHIVWCTKYRKKVLKGEIGHSLRDQCKKVCSELNVEILSGVVSADHVHLLLSIPPKVAVSKLVQRLKGHSSHQMQRKFKTLKKQYWGQRMWARGYFACTTGNVTDEMVKAYIEGHTETEDSFKVESDFKSEP